MLVVKHKDTGEILYRSEPEFEEGMGIKNASIIEGIPEIELEEVEITQQEWDDHIAAQKDISNVVVLKEVSEGPAAPPEGEAFLYLKNVDGKKTVMVRNPDKDGVPDITELVREA